VVPGVRALECRAVERLDHRDIERRLEFLEKDAERGAHDAGAHQDDIRLAAIFAHGSSRRRARSQIGMYVHFNPLGAFTKYPTASYSRSCLASSSRSLTFST